MTSESTHGRLLPPMARGSAGIATATWNQNSASVTSSVASGQYLRIRDFSIAETILWFMLKCLLLLCVVYMSGLEMTTVIKKLWGKVTFLKSQVLWPHCICWRRVFKKRECLIWCSILQVKNDKLKHQLKYHFYVSECQRAQMWEKGALPHGGTRVWTDTHSMEVNLATSMKIKISPALWHSYSTSKNLSYKIFRVALNDIWRKVLIATLFIVVKHVHQGELVKIIMIFIHVTRYRSRCASPKGGKKKTLPNRIFYQTEYLILFNFCRKKIYVRCLYRYSKRAGTRSIHWCH